MKLTEEQMELLANSIFDRLSSEYGWCQECGAFQDSQKDVTIAAIIRGLRDQTD